MGLLKVGKPLTWEEAKIHSVYVRHHGLLQFLQVWNRIKDISDDKLRWGDEVECGVFKIDTENKTVKLSIRSAEITKALDEKEIEMDHLTEGCTWHPEFGAWMVESTPSLPYSNYVSDLLRVEKNMTLRRRRLLSVLKPNEIVPYMTCFPLMGTTNFVDLPEDGFQAPYSQSLYVPDFVINPHPRFAALTNNIRTRRGSKVDIRVPLYQDINTPEYLNITSEKLNEQNDEDNIVPLQPYIHMDCMAFGMGMCCLQVTFQARDVCESRYMYDQLAVLAPIMLAMTAATPIFKGRLSNIDARWTVISQSVDDRTPAERGLITSSDDLQKLANESSDMVGKGVKRLPKSRYDSISTYIYHCSGDASCERSFAYYNDISCPIDEEAKQILLNAGVDMNLAHHLAHLFVRDPLVIFEDAIEIDDTIYTDHFENIQSTNWQTVRWKPPPPRVTPNDPHIGWRCEFRSMELQLTDFENAAFTVFVVLITRVILAFDLAFYIPLSKVDENMKRAHEVDAINNQLFYFRRFMAPLDMNNPDIVQMVERASDSQKSPRSQEKTSSFGCHACQGDEPIDVSVSEESQKWPGATVNNSYEEMTIDEIFNGKDCYFPGLLPLVYAYLDFVKCDEETFQHIDQYLKFVSLRATGSLMTTATWIREFVTNHPDYKHDSVVSESIAYDLMIACKEIGEGERSCPELLGDVKITRIRPEDAYGHLLDRKIDSNEDRGALMNYLLQRARSRRPRERVRGLSLSEMNTLK